MSLAATLTQSLRDKYPNNLDKNEVRLSNYGCKDLFQKDTEDTMGILSNDAKGQIKQSFGNTVEIPVLNRNSGLSISNTRTCNVVDTSNTSALVTLTFITYAFSFTMTPAQYMNNDIKYQADFDRSLLERVKLLSDTIDTQCYNTANTNRNIFYPANILNYYPQVGNTLQVPQTDKADYYNQMQAVMMEMDFMDAPYNVMHSTSHNPMTARLMNQGLGNAVNEQFQFNNAFNYFGSNRVPNGAGVESTTLMSTPGTYAMDNRNDADCVRGAVIGDSANPIKEWSEQYIPIVDMDMGVYYQADCSDQSAKGGGASTRSVLESWEFSTDVMFLTSYNSDPTTDFTPIVKSEILQ